MEKTKSRELWIDVCKSVLIYFMVLGHCGFIEYNKWFYAFHMPCFFMISGYLYKSHSPRVIIKRLFIPVLCFSVINVCWKILIGYISNDLDVYMLLRKGLTTYFMSGSGVSFFPGVWFICVLFFCRCIVIVYLNFFALFSVIRIFSAIAALYTKFYWRFQTILTSA